MLRTIRISLALICFTLITLLFLDFTGTLHAWFGWLARIQFLPALLAVDAGIVAALVILTLLLGRVYCSVICPLGVFQDIVAWLGRRPKRRKLPYSYSPALSWLRYGMLGLFVAALVAGIGSLAALLAPYSAYGRMAANLFQPLWIWGNNLLAYIAERMGVTNVYMALYDDPDLLHAMMERFTEATLSLIDEIDAAKAANLYDPYCHCSHTFLPDDARMGNVCKDGQIGGAASEAWGFGLAQLFTSVSPDVTEEFEVAYMKRLFPRFKHIYYGCCDRLDDRMDRILKLPNVRKISCSPWSNADAFAERIPKDLVMSAKPNPAFFAAKSFDLDAVRADLRAKIAAAKRNSVNLEFIFKDVSTVNCNPQTLTDTAKAAVELMEEEYA